MSSGALFHGCLLIVDKLFLLDIFKSTPKILKHAYVLLMVMVSWVFFRADTLNWAVHFIGMMFGFEHGQYDTIPLAYIFSPHICLVLVAAFIAATPVTRYLKVPFFGNPFILDRADTWGPVKFGRLAFCLSCFSCV